MDPVNHGDSRYADSTNPFAAGLERTIAADGVIVYGRMPSFNLASPPTPPSSRLTNPFLMPVEPQNKTDGESAYLYQQTCDCSKRITSSSATAPPYSLKNSPTPTFTLRDANQLANPFTSMNCMAQNPFSPAHTLLSQFTSTLLPPCMPRPMECSGVISYDDNYASHRDRYQYGQSAVERAKPAPQLSHTEPDVEIMDTSDDEYYGHKERIPILKPGHFDGTGSLNGHRH